MSYPGLAPNAAQKAVASSLTAKTRPSPEPVRAPPLTLSERILVVTVMIAAWIVMSVLSIVQR